MEKRRIEINDKRAGSDPADAAEQLVDLGETPVEVSVPESDSELGEKAAWQQAPAPADSAAQAGTPAPTRDEDLEHFRAKAAEYLDLAQRKEAELRNYAKRSMQDMEDARRYAVEALLESLFPALDGLAQAARTYKDKPAGSDPLLDGVRGTIRALEGALLKNGIQKISDCPAPYDPELHQALTVEDSDEVTEDTVTEIYVDGYRLGDKILKPAMVKVEKAAE